MENKVIGEIITIINRDFHMMKSIKYNKMNFLTARYMAGKNIYVVGINVSCDNKVFISIGHPHIIPAEARAAYALHFADEPGWIFNPKRGEFSVASSFYFTKRGFKKELRDLMKHADMQDIQSCRFIEDLRTNERVELINLMEKSLNFFKTHKDSSVIMH